MKGLLGSLQFKDVFLRLQKEYLEHAAKTGYLDFDPEVPIAYTKAIEALEENEAYRQIIQQLKERFETDSDAKSAVSEGSDSEALAAFNNGMKYALDLLDEAASEVGGSLTCSTEKE